VARALAPPRRQIKSRKRESPWQTTRQQSGPPGWGGDLKPIMDAYTTLCQSFCPRQTDTQSFLVFHALE
jgi:hypothetical protein